MNGDPLFPGDFFTLPPSCSFATAFQLCSQPVSQHPMHTCASATTMMMMMTHANPLVLSRESTTHPHFRLCIYDVRESLSLTLQICVFFSCFISLLLLRLLHIYRFSNTLCVPTLLLLHRRSFLKLLCAIIVFLYRLCRHCR